MASSLAVAPGEPPRVPVRSVGPARKSSCFASWGSGHVIHGLPGDRATPCAVAGRSELLVQLQALVLLGARAQPGWAAALRAGQVVLDDGGAVQPLHDGHEVVQLLEAAVLLLKELQDGCRGAALTGHEPGREVGEGAAVGGGRGA